MDTVWFQSLSEATILQALPAAVGADIRYLESSGLEPLDIGSYLAAQNDGAYSTRSIGRSASEFWAQLQRELYTLVCTDDPKYTSVRESLGKESNVSGAVVLSLIFSAVGAHVGVEAGLATPFVALLLMALLRTSKEAWCAQVGGNLPPPNV